MIKVKVKNIESEFKKLIRQSEQEQDAQATLMVNTMKNELAAATPVDTGHARDSWNITKFKQVFNVNNDAEYIERLNAGTSKQAPSRFIETIALKYGKPFGTIVNKK